MVSCSSTDGKSTRRSLSGPPRLSWILACWLDRVLVRLLSTRHCTVSLLRRIVNVAVSPGIIALVAAIRADELSMAWPLKWVMMSPRSSPAGGAAAGYQEQNARPRVVFGEVNAQHAALDRMGRHADDPYRLGQITGARRRDPAAGRRRCFLAPPIAGKPSAAIFRTARSLPRSTPSNRRNTGYHRPART